MKMAAEFYISCYNRTFSSSSLSVFILWFSRFDVNLFRHRHFRFIIVNVHKTNLLYKMDFIYMQLVDLRRFLQKRGVSCSFYWKYHLERLFKLAHEMYFEVIIVKLLILIHIRSQTPGD